MRTNNLISIVFLFFIFFYSCNQNNTVEDANISNDTVVNITIPPIKAGNYYDIDFGKSNSVLIADTVTYAIEIKNNDKYDTWNEECLQYVNRNALRNIIFNAIYNKRLTAYDYSTGKAMSIEEVRALENKNDRELISKIQFVEKWFFDENNLIFGKKVISIMLAYERKNDEGEVLGYKAGIVVRFNENKNDTVF